MGSLRTDFLFANPSILSGIARILDLFGVFDFYNASRDGNEADFRAIYSDWSVVGNDISTAVHSVRNNPDQMLLFPRK
jgi:hypothetical protein